MDSEQHDRAIQETTQDVMNARSLNDGWTLSQLYDSDMMPLALRKAHQKLDRAVWEAYGRAWPINEESACVAHLMKLYQEFVNK
jgi:hypothetical protein